MIGLSLVGGSAHADGFIDDSHANLRLRNLYYDNDFRDGHGAGGSRQTEWGQAFSLNLQSGFTEGTVGVGADVFALWAFKLDSGGKSGDPNSSRQPAIIFPRASDNSSVNEFTNAYLSPKIRISKTVVQHGAYLPRLPILWASTGSLAPQIFEGTVFTSKEIEGLTVLGGLLEHSKGRASSDGNSMSILGANSGRAAYGTAANAKLYGTRVPGQAQDSNHYWFLGSEYEVSKSLTLRYYYSNLADFYTQNMVGALHTMRLGPGELQSDWRYYDSRGDGKNASFAGRSEGYVSSGYYGNGVTLGEVDNRLASGLVTYLIEGHSVSLGYQQLDGKSDFVWPNQGDGSIAPITTDIQIAKFARAGERTRQFRYSYDFAPVGLPGLSAGWMFMKGDHIKSAEGFQREQVSIYNLTYAVQNGPLKGLAVRFDKGMTNTEVQTSRDMDESRLSIDYNIRLF